MPRHKNPIPDVITAAREMVRDGEDPIGVAHTTRFRKIHHRYARQVRDAFGGDIFAAACSTDDEVAERVRQFEIAEGLEPADWAALGREENEA